MTNFNFKFTCLDLPAAPGPACSGVQRRADTCIDIDLDPRSRGELASPIESDRAQAADPDQI